jgi:AraC family cel operon transcriptional repressor
MTSSRLPRLRWRNFADEADAYHVARTAHTTRTPCAVHTHEFAELFWVNEGTGWHAINGDRCALSPGDLWFIRPEDAHGFSVSAGQRLVMTNVAFPVAAVAHLRARYFPRERHAWWAERTGLAARLTPAALHRLNEAADALARAPRDLLHLDRFLLNVFAELVSDTPEVRPATVPDWLAEACRQLRQPDRLAQGVSGFFRLAGRSSEHVARVMRKTMNTTPTDYLNAVRISQAAFQLRMTNTPVTQVALAAGFQNLSHFFALFRARHGCSPGRYRQRRATPG